MITTADGYTAIYSRQSNQIIIYLPQTVETLTNTVSMVGNRKTDIGDSDLMVLIELARYICER